MPSRQTGRNRPRSGLPEAGRKTHVPASEASRPRSRSDRLADCPRAPSPCRQILHSPVHTESMKPDFVNGLLKGKRKPSPLPRAAGGVLLETPVPKPSAGFTRMADLSNQVID